MDVMPVCSTILDGRIEMFKLARETSSSFSLLLMLVEILSLKTFPLFFVDNVFAASEQLVNVLRKLAVRQATNKVRISANTHLIAFSSTTWGREAVGGGRGGNGVVR